MSITERDMRNPGVISRGVMIATLMSLSAAVHADAQDDAVQAKCPGIAIWTSKMRASHAALTHEALAAEDAAGAFSNPNLRKAIDERFTTDQADRFAVIHANASPESLKKMFANDTERLRWLKPQLTTNGFPTVAQVGHTGVDEAFTLVQHADQDPAFQEAMLPAVTQAAEAGELLKEGVAMLTDRVLRHANKPQRYGTQYTMPSGDMQAMTLQPTEDLAHLDERRASMDLMPEKDYECELRIVNTPAGPTP